MCDVIARRKYTGCAREVIFFFFFFFVLAAPYKETLKLHFDGTVCWGVFLGTTFGLLMKWDEEAPLYVGIKPRRHGLSMTVNKRMRYPFKAMIVNDYFVVESTTAAVAVRNALKSFYRRMPSRQFTVRQKQDVDGMWIVRRVM